LGAESGAWPRKAVAVMSDNWSEEELEQLLIDCAGGDRLAWRSLLENVRTQALDRAQQIYGLGWEDAEDLAQQVQIRVAERLSQLRQPRSFPRWLRRLIHHAALDTLRQRRLLLSTDALAASEVSLEVVWHQVAGTEAANPYDQALLRADLTRALARLPARYREPIRLHLLQGLSQDEVGRLLGRPRSTVATQIERGLDRLRRILAGLAPDGTML
jgi:RNA polymerase sigma-70 factor, ECF subfamily